VISLYQRTANATEKSARTLGACSKSSAFQVHVVRDISADEHQAIKQATRQAANTLDACSVGRAFQVDLIRNKVGIRTIAKQDETIAKKSLNKQSLRNVVSFNTKVATSAGELW
jgi:hypothetical protein